MADRVIHISEAEAARDFVGLLARVRAGAEVVIENGTMPVAVIHAPVPPRRSISECIALLPESSTAVMDADFAKDVEAAIESHREPLEPPAWDQSSIPACSSLPSAGGKMHDRCFPPYRPRWGIPRSPSPL